MSTEPGKKVTAQLIAVMFTLIALLMLLIGPATAQADDPNTVVGAYLDAAVAKDLDAALALLADNISHTDTHAPPSVPGVTQGKADFGAYLKGFFDDPGYRLEYANVQASGDTVTWTTKEWFDPNNAPPNFPLPIESHLQAVVTNGRITSILLENDPAWLEKLYAAIPPEAIDPASVVQLWTKAFNARDPEALKATMSNDIVLKIVYGKGDDPVLTGQDAVLEVMQSSNEDHFTLEVGSLISDGATVTGGYSGSGDDIRAHNVGPEIGTVEARVEDGLIKTITFTADAEFNKKYAEAEAKLQEQAAPDALPTLVGTWHIKVPDPGTNEVMFEALHTYHADGTLTETSSLLGLREEGPAHGVWSGEGDDYAVTFYLFAFDKETGEHTGMYRVRGIFHLDGPDHFTGQAAAEIIDLNNGKVIPLGGAGPLEGARLKVEPLYDPLTIVQTYLEAINNKNLDTAMSFLADDAIMSYPDGQFQGKEAIQEAYQSLLALGYHSEFSNLRQSNGQVGYDYKVYFGDEMVDQNTDGLAIVKNGKIVFDGLEKDKPQ